MSNGISMLKLEFGQNARQMGAGVLKDAKKYNQVDTNQGFDYRPRK
ncbi:MAG TPA: hypothetical protein PLK94_07035 [Alphaproteobacteria bacterium]|nr:hypothetical protein [Alphaproteobacteria bacterium]HOO51023.1 hypothetical protein [Alphaproteobacteria bacterium]